MKIIWEIGDVVELEDSSEVPNEMGAMNVELISNLGDKFWEVKIECDSWGISPKNPSGAIRYISENWFTNNY